MSVTVRAVHSDDNTFGVYRDTADENKNLKNRKTVFAGNLNMPSTTSQLVEQKRNQARKQAMKLINDAWGRDNKTTDNIQGMSDDKSAQVDKLGELNSKLKNINDNKKALMEEYGIDPDSEEQKDLELLEKYQNNINGSSYDEFSEDEINRLKELQNMPRTEYQNRVLQQNASAGRINLEIERTKSQIIAMTQAISDAKIEQLKSQDMLKADGAADEIMDAVNDEIFGLLIKEGVDHVDEVQEEQQEKAEETAEKREEKEERLEVAKENRDEMEERIEQMKENSEELEVLVKEDVDADKLGADISMHKQSSDYVEEAQKNIQKILKENNLINEDLKGIKIDFNF